VQDEGSQLVALALAGAPLGPSNRPALDDGADTVSGPDASPASDTTPAATDVSGAPGAPRSAADAPDADAPDASPASDVPLTQGLSQPSDTSPSTPETPAAVPGDRLWLDMCAGPGGKAALLAAVAAQRGARLIAAEAAPHRARLVKRALQPIHGLHKAITADGTAPPWREAIFDRVLVDAPCTGLGALRRRPESRWRREPQDVPQLARLQKRLLVSAFRAVRPGGVVAYVTCSPHLAETRDVVAAVLAHHGVPTPGESGPGHPRVEQIDARPLLPGVPDLGDGPDVQLWPHLHGTDAMYLAMFRRLPDA
jgi:16S rRNA C967 or C1407 C5-methylase (RsmB/RsmF family)